MTMKYVVDESGVPVDGYQASHICSVARSNWEYLASNGLAPEKWKTFCSADVANWFHREMEAQFPLLRLCQGHWKSNQIAIDNYPNWCVNRLKGKEVSPKDEPADGESATLKRKDNQDSPLSAKKA